MRQATMALVVMLAGCGSNGIDAHLPGKAPTDSALVVEAGTPAQPDAAGRTDAGSRDAQDHDAAPTQPMDALAVDLLGPDAAADPIARDTSINTEPLTEVFCKIPEKYLDGPYSNCPGAPGSVPCPGWPNIMTMPVYHAMARRGDAGLPHSEVTMQLGTLNPDGGTTWETSVIGDGPSDAYVVVGTTEFYTMPVVAMFGVSIYFHASVDRRKFPTTIVLVPSPIVVNGRIEQPPTETLPCEAP